MTSLSDMLARLRAEAPLVQIITNHVAMNITANVLLAAGASPAMVHAEEEAGEFAGLARAVVVNIGTLSSPWVVGMKRAAAAASAGGKPWVLDPVAHFATAFRRRTVGELMALRPSVVRANASEILALAGSASAGQGVDSGDSVERAEAAAHRLALAHHAVIAVTGAIDFVTDGKRSARVEGGSPLMPKVTALGCALSALCGAFAAVAPDELFDATLAALAMFAAAGDAAGRGAAGPGSFAVAFLDALSALDGGALAGRITTL